MACKKGAEPIPRVPFAKWRGFPLWQVPSDYLSWLLSWPELRPPLKGHVEVKLRRRGLCVGNAEPRLDTTVVEQARRQLAKKFHPDLTHGNSMVMAGANAACDPRCF